MDQVLAPMMDMPKYALHTVAREMTEVGQKEKVIGCVVWYVIFDVLKIEGLELIGLVCYRQLCHAREMFQVQRPTTRYVFPSFLHLIAFSLTMEAEMASTGIPGIPALKVANNGDNDAAPESQPSQFLLFRGLEPSVTEELLAKGVAKLYRPSGNNDNASSNQKKGSKVASTTGDSNLGAREGSIRRVLLVRDRKSNESWRYGFAEFAGILVCSFPPSRHPALAFGLF